MQFPVFFLAWEEAEVGDSVVLLVEIDVVDYFRVAERASQVFFHDESMLEDSAISVGFRVVWGVLEPVAFVVLGFFGFELLAGWGAILGVGSGGFLEGVATCGAYCHHTLLRGGQKWSYPHFQRFQAISPDSGPFPLFSSL